MKKSVKLSELTITLDNHSQIISQISFRCLGSNIHPSQFTCRFPFYEPSGQHLPFNHLFPAGRLMLILFPYDILSISFRLS